MTQGFGLPFFFIKDFIFIPLSIAFYSPHVSAGLTEQQSSKQNQVGPFDELL